MNKTIIHKDWWFTFKSATGNLFIYECYRDEDLTVTVDIYDLSYVDFDNTMTFRELILFDDVEVYYNFELIDWESI